MTQHNHTAIRRAIVVIIDEQDTVEGTCALAEKLNMLNTKSYLVRSARILADQGEITIIPSRGGRGIKTVYKRNRNQPGQPRRRTR